MGKRSSFGRVPRDFYPTPYEAVVPLLPHLMPATRFDEPCCGDWALIRHLEAHGHRCIYRSDITHGIDALRLTDCRGRCFITNPPWSRKILHPLITRLSNIAPTWLLVDADWKHTKQAARLLPHCRKIVSVGRVKWMPGTKHTGKDNCAWYLFDRQAIGAPVFYGRAA